jgi:hypothetical protein
MYANENYRSPYPCYRPSNSSAASATIAAGASTTHTNALCVDLSENALYLIGLINLLQDLAGPQAVQESLMPTRNSKY